MKRRPLSQTVQSLSLRNARTPKKIMFWQNQPSPLSSSEEEGRRSSDEDHRRAAPYRSPYAGGYRSKIDVTPMTVMQMTPSPIQSPLISDLSPIETASFASMQQTYLDQSISTPTAVLFRDSTPTKRHRRRVRSSRRARLSGSLQLEDSFDSKPPLVAAARRRSDCSKYRGSPYTSDTSSETSASGRIERGVPRTSGSPPRLNAQQESPFKLNHHWFIQMSFACMLVVSAAGMLFLTNSAVPTEHYQPLRPEMHLTEAGLRGKMVQGRWDGAKANIPRGSKSHKKAIKSKRHDGKEKRKEMEHNNKPKKETKKEGSKSHQRENTLPRVILPSPIHHVKIKFDSQDSALYSTVTTNKRRVVALDPSLPIPHHRKIKLFPADVTDNTQLYPMLDSSDERLSKMEIKEPYSTDECVPMQNWQTEFHPSCNEMHELPLANMGVDNDMEINLFGTNGFWRNAWKVDFEDDHDTVVLKTLK